MPGKKPYIRALNRVGMFPQLASLLHLAFTCLSLQVSLIDPFSSTLTTFFFFKPTRFSPSLLLKKELL